MLSWIREKFGTVIIGSIISFIAFVFVFYGFFSPKATRGLHEGAVAGTVNGEAISLADFHRALHRKIDFIKNIGAGKITDAQLKTLHIREAVFQELTQHKILIQEAKHRGLIIADLEIMKHIREVPIFQQAGRFDLETYKQILEANHQTPGNFERLLREDLMAQKWGDYFKERIHTSESELKHEFSILHQKRNIKYVVINYNNTANPTPVSHQTTTPVHSLSEAEALALANQCVHLMTKNPSSDTKINALMAAVSGKVKTTGWIHYLTSNVPDIGDVKELFTDAFKIQSPLHPPLGGHAKKYPATGRLLVALVIESQEPDWKHFKEQDPQLIAHLLERKIRNLYQDWIKKIVQQTKIRMNQDVMNAESI